MPRCPNCGQETKRTEDWACQWCGYPLFSNAYKKIAKTYKQLVEERLYGVEEAAPEETEAPPPRQKPAPPRRPEPPPVRPPERPPKPALGPEAEAIPGPEPMPERKPEPVPEAKPVAPPEFLSAPPEPPVTEALTPPQPGPSPVLNEPPPGAEARPSQLEPAPPPPEPFPEPQPQPVPQLEPETAAGVVKTTVDVLDAAFKADHVTANARLKDKTVEVSGVVDKTMVKDSFDIRYALLTGTGKQVVWNVRCTFAREDAPALLHLKEKQPVTIQGKYDGYGRNIVLRDCTLIG